jgi:hypothetical protein
LLASIAVSVNQPLVIPDFEARTKVREDVQPVRRLYRHIVVVAVDVMRRIDVLPKIEKVEAIKRHSFC